MHPLDKIKFKAFDGVVDVHGTDRDVSFIGPDGDEPSVLVIKGLKLEDAFHVLDHLRGGLLKDKDAEQPKVRVDNTDTVTVASPVKAAKPIDFAKKARELKAANALKEQEQLALPIEEGEETDEDDEAAEAAPPPEALDVATMAKMEKLREVIEYMVGAGHDTVDKIVAVSRQYKDTVPVLKLVDEKGSFDKRMERNALVVFAGRSQN